MLSFKSFSKHFYSRLAIVIISLFAFSISSYSKEPILKYLFDETGTIANSTGSDKTPLTFLIANGVEDDLHTGGGLGVSGSPNDRAFDNYSWCNPHQGGIALAKSEELATKIAGLKSLTIQGWFWAEEIQASYLTPKGGLNEAPIVRGPFMLDMSQSIEDIRLRFRVATNRAISGVGYAKTKEWVFFAVTYDKTKRSQNVNFYIGTKTQPVTLVSTTTLIVELREDLLFQLGGHTPGGVGMFYGLLDNILLYGSDTDDTGVLTPEELENIRTNDLIPLGSGPSESEEELENQLNAWEDQLNEYEVEFNKINVSTEYAIELKRKTLDKIRSLRDEITKIRSRQIIRDSEASLLNAGMVTLDNALLYLVEINQSSIGTNDVIVSTVSPISEVPILPHYNPDDDLLGIYGTIGDRLYVVATPGEYEPASFVVHALSDINSLQVEVSDLKMETSKIYASNIDIKAVKCWYQAGTAWNAIQQDKQNKVLVPELLLNDDSLVQVDYEAQENYLKLRFQNKEQYIWISNPADESRAAMSLSCQDFPIKDSSILQPVDISSNTNKQFWITVKVPDDAPAGLYKGCIKLFTNNKSIAALSLFVRVLPFELADPYYDSSIYYRGKLIDDECVITSELKSEEQFKRDLENMIAHGVSNPRVIIRRKNPLSWKDGPDLEELERVLEIRESVGIVGQPLQLAAGGYNLGFPMNAVTPENLEILRRNVRDVLTVTERFNIPEVYFYAIDEARGDILTSQKTVWRAIQEAGGKVNVAGYRGHFDLVGDTLDMLICYGHPNQNEVDNWHAEGKKIYCYANPQAGLENPEIYRRNYGLLLWEYDYDGACTFAYQMDYGNIWNDFDHTKYRDLNLTYPTVDSMIDTIAWEGYREGVDDVRYVTTLIQEIEKAKNSSNLESKAAAADAEAYLAKLRQEVHKRNLDIVRLEIIYHILNIIK